MSLPEIKPRNYIPGGEVLHHTYDVMLRDHPEAFDVIVFPALESEQNEFNAVDAPEITVLDREQRQQRYGEPFACRAIISPDEAWGFDITDAEMLEAFHGSNVPINLLLSVRGVRTFSIIQWREYTDLEGEETVERTVYVSSTKPVGRTMNTWNLHVCFPLFNEGDIPEVPEDDTESDQESGQEGGQNGEHLDEQEGTQDTENTDESDNILSDISSDISGDIDSDIPGDLTDEAKLELAAIAAKEGLHFDGYMEVDIPHDEDDDNQVGTL